jgi:hypothetical protein
VASAGADHEAGFDIDLPPGADEVWDEGEEPPAAPPGLATAPARTMTPNDRRFVVIDEDADPTTTPTQVQPERPSATPRGGVGKIGATLEEEGAPKRRWRLFRKGGE